VTAVAALVTVTLRGLLGRRRMILMLLLVSVPILVGILIRIAGGSRETSQLLDALVIRTVLPLVALIIGTSAIGSEIEDGTLVYLLVKPIARWRTALSKLVVAAGLSAVLVVPPMVITGLLVSGGDGAALGTTFGYALAGLVGVMAYAAAFTALGALTSRALIVGLVYVLLWEGVLAGLLEGTRFLSVRQATLGLAAAWTGESSGRAPLEPTVSALILLVVVVGSFAITAYALARFQIRSAD
jgi:ABC-2 type transport system permease protein